MLVLPPCVVTMSDLMRVSHSGTSKLKIPETRVAPYSLCVPGVHLTHSVNGKALACIV